MAEWFAATGDVASAYVCQRKTDDPAIYRRIAISVDGNVEYTHLIHTSFDNASWTVVDVRHKSEAHQFDSLVEALNFVRDVLHQSMNPSDPQSDQARGQQADRLPASQEIERERVGRVETNCKGTDAPQMTPIGRFIAGLQQERRSQNISSETEQHLKCEFRKLGWNAPGSTLAMAVGKEIDRLDREAATLRKLRAGLLGVE